MSCHDFIAARKAALEAEILALEAAFTQLSTGVIQSYTLDTGQDRQVVTKYEISSLRRTIDSLYNSYATLCARLNGGTTMIARPTF
jgi:hypothetical protein